MSHGFFLKKMNRPAVFEFFFRKHPFDGGFSLFAGLDPLLDKLEGLRFSPSDIGYLETLNVFKDDFLRFLSDFRFSGSVHAMDEGTAIFPQEPVVRITGNLIECQLVEGLVLNTVNFQSLIATKAARVCLAASRSGPSREGQVSGDRPLSVMEFGLRRAPGPDGAMSATRASVVGGVTGTSNVAGAKEFGIKPLGTMAHSWVMAFGNEEEAFAAYAELYPTNAVFLIDTYDTLGAGLEAAINVGKKIRAAGGNFGVRLDSGDLYYLTCEVRKRLDAAGLKNAAITVSNDLDEEVIAALTEQGAPIDSWGVGTRMVTGGNEAAFSGVYKLAAFEDETGRMVPGIKVSDNPEKTTNPAVKQVYRIFDEAGEAIADILAKDGEETIEKGGTYTFWHPQADYRHFTCKVEGESEALLKLKMKDGRRAVPPVPLPEIQQHASSSLARFDSTYKRQLNPHVYKVSITESIRQLKLDLIKKFLG
jgi:nicotinate phosphoribosyltransferase